MLKRPPDQPDGLGDFEPHPICLDGASKVVHLAGAGRP
jgi:hypothetical protein